MADSSKTEKATPKKRRDERKKGNVFMSQDVVSVATLAVSFIALLLVIGSLAEGLAVVLRMAIGACGKFHEEIGPALSDIERKSLVVMLFTILIPLATVICAVAVTFAQTKLLVSGELMRPKFSRINPLQGAKRLFSLKSVVDALKNMLKITLLLFIIYISLKAMVDESPRYLYTDVAASARHIFDVAKTMAIRVIAAFAVLGAFDYGYQWWEYERNMRMSKQEIKEEYKQTEGDPQIKGKIKEQQRRMAQSRMMQQVPGADVVIRNPTHVAVALRYKPDRDSAPIVLAKGQDELALRIVRVAQDSGVKTIENIPLARALYASTELNQEIPPEFYGAVAEVLVHIIKLDKKAGGPKGQKH